MNLEKNANQLKNYGNFNKQKVVISLGLKINKKKLYILHVPLQL